ncbi:unnamed protein product [Parascedosporium putredinis]|uniref:Uncharacterized protein n=1 Tax=Parascedosporium putredinis TaxID=1442378 RepID=A0A9P1GU71_9PEZI|nr:unnamed protein product [Parascedosporium putredinis]CAI7987396.1 unnamed protein product [Parascedosporium putredinis]
MKHISLLVAAVITVSGVHAGLNPSHEVWQCAPIVAEECCTTGYYCEAGTHCYLEDDTGDQYCLTPEEVAEQEQAVGDDDDSTSSGSSGGGGIRFKPTKPASAAAAAQTVSSKVGGAGGALAGVVAFGALALAMA